MFSLKCSIDMTCMNTSKQCGELWGSDEVGGSLVSPQSESQASDSNLANSLRVTPDALISPLRHGPPHPRYSISIIKVPHLIVLSKSQLFGHLSRSYGIPLLCATSNTHIQQRRNTNSGRAFICSACIVKPMGQLRLEERSYRSLL